MMILTQSHYTPKIRGTVHSTIKGNTLKMALFEAQETIGDYFLP